MLKTEALGAGQSREQWRGRRVTTGKDEREVDETARALGREGLLQSATFWKYGRRQQRDRVGGRTGVEGSRVGGRTDVSEECASSVFSFSCR